MAIVKALTDPECSIEFKPIGQWLAIFVCRPKQEHLVAVFDNITGRKEVEQALQREALLHTVIDTTPDAVYARTPTAGWCCSTPRHAGWWGSRQSGSWATTTVTSTMIRESLLLSSRTTSA